METERQGPAAGPSWFAVAVRALAMLAANNGVCPSAAIACEVRTHAVFLRRILAQLVRAGLIVAREGRDGGYQLTRCPTSITLAEIYSSLSSSPIAVNPMPLSTTCLGESALASALSDVIREAEQQVMAVLARYTLADMLARSNTEAIARR